jgi:hypothetical protein
MLCARLHQHGARAHVLQLLEKLPYLRDSGEAHALFLPSTAPAPSAATTPVTPSQSVASLAGAHGESGRGQWLDDDSTFAACGVDADTTAEFRLRPWRFNVQLYGKVRDVIGVAVVVIGMIVRACMHRATVSRRVW